jgi:hypothetical protein
LKDPFSKDIPIYCACGHIISHYPTLNPPRGAKLIMSKGCKVCKEGVPGTPTPAYAALQWRHWTMRWKKPGLDSCMGVRGLIPENKTASYVIIHILNAKSVLDIGAGCWRLLKACHQNGIKRLAGTELPIERAKECKPEYVEGYFNLRPFPLPWKDKEFDVVYQCNSLPNMVSSDIPHVLDEMVRIGKLIVMAGSWRCRFWEWKTRTAIEKIRWMRDLIESRCELVSTHKHNVTVWKPKN